MNSKLNYLDTEYARNKMIEEYNKPYMEKKMKTGKAIVDRWNEECLGYRITDSGMAQLKKSIDAALQAARTEGEIAGAERMVEVVRKTMV